MSLPYKLTTNIDGLSVWCYDFNRSPSKDDKITNICTNATGDYIMPVSKTFVKYDDKVHQVRLVCDINHHFSGSGKIVFDNAYGPNNYWANDYYTFTESSSYRYYSHLYFSNLRPVDAVLVHAEGTPLEPDSKTAVITNSEGVTISAQTGIVHKSRGAGFIVFTIADGYKIPAKSTITVNGSYQNALSGRVIHGTNSTFTTDYDITSGIYLMKITDNKYLLSCSVDFPTVSNKPKHKINWQLTNCTVSPADTQLDEGSHTWTFKANSGYRFDKPGGIFNVNTGNYGNEIIATNTDTTTLTYDLTRDIDVKLTANAIPQTVTTIPLLQKLTHATSNVGSSEIDRKINQLTLTADSGYIFKDDILVQLFTGSNVTQSFNVAGNGSTTATITFNTNTQNTIVDSMTNIVITTTAVKPEASVGYAHYYAITNTELHSFSKEHIWNYVGNGTETAYDVSKYIDNLIELPFRYDTTDLPTSKIAVGRVATATTSHELRDRFYTIDFGKITVPAKYKNGYDYQIRTCKLYLPFAPTVSIDIGNAMEQTIHIVYKIDMSTGNATITLDNSGTPFNTINLNLADRLPFLNALKNTIIKDGSHQIYNGIRNPYLVITRQQPILDSDFYPTKEVGKVTSYHGRLKATMLDSSGINDSVDFEELQNLLAEGVVYNA